MTGSSLLLKILIPTIVVSAAYAQVTLKGKATLKSQAASYNGYFVLSAAGTLGNMGGLSGANTTCLNELQSNSFKGKATAHIDSGHVFAFLCDDTTCNNLQANTTYYYAVSGSNSTGGGSFTTDGTGLGPGESATSWAATSRFGGTFALWTGRNSTSASQWANTSTGANCTSWSTSAGGSNKAEGATTNSSTATRWTSALVLCSTSQYVICYVNP